MGPLFHRPGPLLGHFLEPLGHFWPLLGSFCAALGALRAQSITFNCIGKIIFGMGFGRRRDYGHPVEQHVLQVSRRPRPTSDSGFWDGLWERGRIVITMRKQTPVATTVNICSNGCFLCFCQLSCEIS